MNMNNVEQLYEPRIARAREIVAHSSVLRRLLDKNVLPNVLERFLIEYCSLGVQITEPVESWISRAGERSKAMGLVHTGAALVAHAHHEANHHLMFIEDTEKLVAHWNARHDEKLDASALIARLPTTAMKQYIALHEDTISSFRPFAQVAIELEIERLSVTTLPVLLGQFKQILGEEILSSLSFLGEHAAIDVGHTHLNTRMMNSLLEIRPDVAADLALTGAEALFIYMAFIEECFEIAAASVSS